MLLTDIEIRARKSKDELFQAVGGEGFYLFGAVKLFELVVAGLSLFGKARMTFSATRKE